jgi:uncharacterized membrane protein
MGGGAVNGLYTVNCHILSGNSPRLFQFKSIKSRVDIRVVLQQKRPRKVSETGAEGQFMDRRVLGLKLRTLYPVLAGVFSLFLFTCAPAKADFRVCNATQSLIGVSIGYRVKTGWTTEGWWHIDASSCKTLIEGPLSSRYYYLYAEDAERGGRWEGPVNMCVAEKEFKVAGINDCFARGFQRAGFQEYDTGAQSSWMVQLTDEPANGAPAAPATPTPGAVAPAAPNP